jgi:predicted lipoprotein with Yx(FWY)xxD motif
MKGSIRTRGLQLAGVTVFFGLLLAACSNGSSGGLYGGSGGGSPASQPTGSSSTTVGTSSISGLGTVIAAPDGLTLYMLTADKGGRPTCTSSACTTTWPPLMVSNASALQATSGVKSNMLGTVASPNGGLQVTYHGWPVYTYSGDSGPGTAAGEKIQSFGGTWFALSAKGTPAGSSSGASSGSSGGSGGNGW